MHKHSLGRDGDMATREELMARTKKCPGCRQTKRGESFVVCTRSDGRIFLAARCKPCTYAATAAARRANPERRKREREYRKQYGPTYNPAYMREKQGASLETATNKGKEWTGPELEVVMRDDLTAAEKAKMLNRTVHAVYSMRRDCKRDPRKQALHGADRGDL